MISPKQAVFGLATVFMVLPDAILFASASTTEKSAGKLRSLGEAAMADRRFDEAVSFYKEAIEVEPENAANYFKLFRVHSRMRSFFAALQDITQACEVDGKNSEYRVSKAKLLVNLGQCEEAVEEYNILNQHGIDTNDDMRKSRDEAHTCAHHLNVATQAHAQNQWDLAVSNFDKALSLMEHNYDYLFMKSQAEFHLGDYYGAISDTGKILKAHSKHIEAYELRGMSYFRLGEHDTAVQHYREGLKLDPEHKGCKGAHKAVKSIMKKDKRGNDAASSGNHQGAIDYWWQAINLDPTHRAFARPTLLKIIKAQSQLGKHNEAAKLAQEHIDEEASLEGLFALGDAQVDAEMFQEAVNTFRQANEFEPNDKQQECKERLKKAEIALKQSKEKNYYKILGISRTADKKAIKKAYRDLALKWHPDKAEDKELAEKKFQDISEAYEVLSDQELRGKYDRGEEVFENQGGGGGGGHHGFPEQMFRQHFQGGGGGGQQRGQQHHFRFH